MSNDKLEVQLVPVPSLEPIIANTGRRISPAISGVEPRFVLIIRKAGAIVLSTLATRAGAQMIVERGGY